MNDNSVITVKECLKGTRYEPLIDLFESPQIISAWNVGELSNMGSNLTVLKKIKEKVPQSTGKFEQYMSYDYTTPNDLRVSVFTNDDQFIKAYVSYWVKNNVLFVDRIWQDALCFGLCRKLMLDYYLPKFSGITSGTLHTSLGRDYWKKLTIESLARGYHIFVLNRQNEKFATITKSEELAQYYHESSLYADFQFLIEK